jgi:glycosyltransferase involved in cell wall biosynthesis
VRVLPNCLPFELSEAVDYERPNEMLFVGRIHPEKGLVLLLRALPRLPATLLREWRLQIVGPHETAQGGGGRAFFDQLQNLAREVPLEVDWIGPVFEEKVLREHYRRAALFVYPSIAETGEALPLAPLEAMANGAVPLVSTLACFEDYIEPKVNGFVFDHQSPAPEEALAEALRTAMAISPDERAQMAAAAHERAREFAPAPVAARYLEDFASLLSPERM